VKTEGECERLITSSKILCEAAQASPFHADALFEQGIKNASAKNFLIKTNKCLTDLLIQFPQHDKIIINNILKNANEFRQSICWSNDLIKLADDFPAYNTDLITLVLNDNDTFLRLICGVSSLIAAVKQFPNHADNIIQLALTHITKGQWLITSHCELEALASAFPDYAKFFTLPLTDIHKHVYNLMQNMPQDAQGCANRLLGNEEKCRPLIPALTNLIRTIKYHGSHLTQSMREAYVKNLITLLNHLKQTQVNHLKQTQAEGTSLLDWAASEKLSFPLLQDNFNLENEIKRRTFIKNYYHLRQRQSVPLFSISFQSDWVKENNIGIIPTELAIELITAHSNQLGSRTQQAWAMTLNPEAKQPKSRRALRM